MTSAVPDIIVDTEISPASLTSVVPDIIVDAAIALLPDDVSEHAL